jgi:hypothetical protein
LGILRLLVDIVTFNSLSRDHFFTMVLAIEQFSTNLSTPSLGITRLRDHRVFLPQRNFQLPLSGSHSFLPLHEIVAENFQLPLSGSHRQRCVFLQRIRTDFQLPLSGSRPRADLPGALPALPFQLPLSGSLLNPESPCCNRLNYVMLSTPSLGITQPKKRKKGFKLSLAQPFNSLSRDHSDRHLLHI